MAIDVFIWRKFKEDRLHDALFLNAELRALATVQPGYVSGTTKVNIDDCNKMLILSTWDSKENWENWLNSDIRFDYHKKMKEALASPEEIEIYESASR